MPEPNPPHSPDAAALSRADRRAESDAVVADGTTLLDVAGTPAGIPPVPADKDPVATYYCKTLKNIALKNIATKKYGVVIVGGRAVGSVVLDRLLHRTWPNKKVKVALVLEKGGFPLPEHVQNLDPRCRRLMMDAVPRPWRAANTGGQSLDLAPQIPYLGGRTQFWSTWIPKPSKAQSKAPMPTWPAKVAEDIEGCRNSAQKHRGAVLPSAMGRQFTKLQPELVGRLNAHLDKEVFDRNIQEPNYEVELACRDTKGSDPTESVTNLHGQLHTVSNVYVGGAATFPTSESWNPTPAAVAPAQRLAQRLADHLLTAVPGATHG